MAVFGGVRPIWPFGNVALTPHRENAPREQCIPCAGGGEINDLACLDCGGRGYFDQHNPRRNRKEPA